VTIEKPNPSATPGADNRVDLTLNSNWIPVNSRAATFKTRGGTEGRIFNQVQAEVSHIIEMRSDPLTRQINPTWRLRYRQQVFNIVAAFDVDMRKKIVRIHAIEVV
jgi:head-tail adaptor